MYRRIGPKAVTWDWDVVNSVSGERTVCLTLSQISMLQTALTVAFWSTRWFNRPSNFSEIEEFVADTSLRLFTDCGEPLPPDAPVVPSGGSNPQISPSEGDCECCMGCGCFAFGADGTLYAVVNSQLIPIGASGGAYTPPAATDTTGRGEQTLPSTSNLTYCDFLTGFPIYYASRLDEFASSAKTVVDSGGNLLDWATNIASTIPAIGVFIDESVELVVSVFGTTIQNVINMAEDTDFVAQLAAAVDLTFGGVVPASITREQLATVGANMPAWWTDSGVPLPVRTIMTQFAGVTDMGAINRQLPQFAGEGDTAFCESIYGANQSDWTIQDPPAPPEPRDPTLALVQPFDLSPADGGYTIPIGTYNPGFINSVNTVPNWTVEYTEIYQFNPGDPRTMTRVEITLVGAEQTTVGGFWPIDAAGQRIGSRIDIPFQQGDNRVWTGSISGTYGISLSFGKNAGGSQFQLTNVQVFGSLVT